MNGLFYLSTIPRALLFGVIGFFVMLGVFSLIGLMSGDPGVSTGNVVASAVGALFGAFIGYFTKENHVMDLKAKGKLDPDSDGRGLPPVQPMNTIPRLIVYIFLLTLMVQGIVALLQLVGLWWSDGPGWGNWVVTLVVVTVVSLMSFRKSKRLRAERPESASIS